MTFFAAILKNHINQARTNPAFFFKPCLCLSDTRHFRRFRRFRGSDERSPCGQDANSSFSPFSSKPSFLAGDKNTVYQKHGLCHPEYKNLVVGMPRKRAKDKLGTSHADSCGFLPESRVRKGVVSKRVVLADVPRHPRTGTRVHPVPNPGMRLHANVPRTKNRNEGTFAKTTLLRNRPFVSSRLFGALWKMSAISREISCGHFPWTLNDENLQKFSPDRSRISFKRFTRTSLWGITGINGGPDFIHPHPPTPENTLLGVGGV